MRTTAILSVVFFALAVASFAQEADEDLIVPEMELVENYTTYHTQTVVQNETETTYKPQGKVIQEPVEVVHQVPVTKTVPVKKTVEVRTIVEAPAKVTAGCNLVVESCFSSPEQAAVPAWKAPVLSYEKSYTTLCADEAAAKKAAEKKHKIYEGKTKEAATKGITAEKASKKLEKALKEAQVKCTEKSTKGEKTAKEVSKKGAEREEKLFTSEKDSKESAAKAISAANTREKIVYVPSAAPKIVPEPVAAPVIPKAAPTPAPAPVVAPAATYVCDAKTCQCVKSTNSQGDDYNYCTEMCSTSPGCTPVPPPSVIPAPPPLPQVFNPAPVPQRVQYVRYQPAVPVPVPAPMPSKEAPLKAELHLKEGMMKAREKGQKAMAETASKQSEQQMKLAATELKQKTAESASKEKVSKHTSTQEVYYKKQPVQQVYAPRPQEPALQSLEKGTKKVVAMKEKFGKAKIQGVNAIKEAWSKHGTVARANNHCKETHEICGKIHTASAARQVTAAKVAATHTAELEANCAKTVAFAKEEARELTFHICAAAAAKLEGLCHSLSQDFEFGSALNSTSL